MGLLSKLGIFRSGSTTATYKSGAERPAEFVFDDVYNAEKDIAIKVDLTPEGAVINASSSKPLSCPQCGKPLGTDAKFCSACGTSAPATPPPVPYKTAPTAGKSGSRWKGCLIGCSVIGCLSLILLPVIGIILALVFQRASPESTVDDVKAIGNGTAQTSTPAEDLSKSAIYSPYQYRKTGFQVELPVHWQRQLKGTTESFCGPADTEESGISINLQVAPRTDATLSDLASSLKAAGGYSLQASSSGSFHDAPAAYLVAEYTLNDVKYRQLLTVVQCPSQYLFIAYAAPATLFDKYRFNMNHMLGTFKFYDPIAPSDQSPDKAAEQLLTTVKSLLQ